MIYVEAEETPPTQDHGLSNGDADGAHEGLYIEPEPIRSALISRDIMDVLDSYTPGSIGGFYV